MNLVSLFAAATFHFSWHTNLWYLLPLVVAVSLVYAATRHEAMQPIFIHAARLAAWLVGFVALINTLLWFLTRNL